MRDECCACLDREHITSTSSPLPAVAGTAWLPVAVVDVSSLNSSSPSDVEIRLLSEQSPFCDAKSMIGRATFREILPDDMESIFDVRVATWDNDRGREELTKSGITHESVRNMLADSHRGWLCEVGSRVVGFAMGNKDNGEMWVIAVLRECEGNGIGKQLLRLVEDWLFAEGWEEIWLTTDRDETIRAVGFYRHLGWTDWKMEPDGDRFMKKAREES